jgi:hypothetical protein
VNQGVFVVRRLLSSLVVIATMFSGSLLAADIAPQEKKETESFRYLEKWVGLDPMTIPEGNTWGIKPHGSIWEDPKIADSLKRTLGDSRDKVLFDGWDEGRIFEFKRTGDFIHFLACSKGTCNRFGTTIFISLIDGGVQACWLDPENMFSGSPNYWLTSKGERKLSEGSCKADNPDGLLREYGDKQD